MIGCLFLLIISVYLFPFSFAGKEKGKRGHGPLRVKITGRMHRPCIPTVRTVSRGVQTVFSGSRIGVRDDTVRIEDGMTGDRIEGGMTRELHWRTG